MAKKKAKKIEPLLEADELDAVRLHGPIEAIRVNDREIALRFRVCGSVECDGGEYSYDEQVTVVAGKCMLEKEDR